MEWIDGRRLPLEGKAFTDVEAFYDRLPASAVATNTNPGVAAMKHHTSGMQFRFTTTSPTVSFRWSPYYDTDVKAMPGMRCNGALGMAHMPPTGVSGIDVYLQGADGRWSYAKTGFIFAGENGATSTGRIDRLAVKPGTPICVNLPLYNGLRNFELGVEKGTVVAPLGPHRGGNRPVVFYGTSITHGGCASRPGLSFVNIVGRNLDVPVVDLGFSGHGRMELAMAQYLARIDAGCYVLDCVWNMWPDLVKANYEPFIRELRRLRPGVPIVMAEWCSVFGVRDGRDAFIRALYDRLCAEGWHNLVYLPKDEMYNGDGEGTVDGTHPNDLGMTTMASAYGKAVRAALDEADALDGAAVPVPAPVAELRRWTWTGAGGDGRWTNPANWSGGTGFPATARDVATVKGPAAFTQDAGRFLDLAALEVTDGTVTICGVPGSGLRFVGTPAGNGSDGVMVGSRTEPSPSVRLVFELPIDCAGRRLDKWFGGSLVLRDAVRNGLAEGRYGFIFGDGSNALERTASLFLPGSSLDLGNGLPNRSGTKSVLRVADAARIDAKLLQVGTRSGGGEAVEVVQDGAQSFVRARGELNVGYRLPGLPRNIYTLTAGRVEAETLCVGGGSAGEFLLQGGELAAKRIRIAPGGVLRVANAARLAPDVELDVARGGKVALGPQVALTVRRLVLDGVVQSAGTHGASAFVEAAAGASITVPAPRASSVRPKVSPIAIGDRLEVFWDDAIVDRAATTAERRVHQPEFAGVVMKHDAPWEGDGSDFHNILEDVDAKGKLYRMYYLGWHFVDQVPPQNHHYSREWAIRVCYAESRDGLAWTKPNLGLHAYHGSKANNILLDAKQFGFSFDNFMVFKDDNPACPADARYKAVARIEGPFGGDAGKGGGLGCFLSADGIHFRPGWLLTRAGAFDSLNLAFWDVTRGEYHCYFRGFHTVAAERNGDLGVRDVRHMVSKDFRTWSEPKLLDFRTPEGTVGEDYPLYTNVVQPYPRAPHLFVGFPSRYVERKAWTPNYDRLPGVENRRYRCRESPRHGLVVTDCVFMMTRDGQRFHREDDAFMRPGPENPLNWVYGDCYPSRGLPLVAPRRPGADPELAFYTFEGHWGGGSEDILRWALRQDGFVSRHAPYAGAKVVTKPLVFDGDELLVNFATSARGRMFVTLREVTTGRELKSCEIFGDKVDRPIDFVGGSPAQFRGQPVVLEFDMSDADVYSFRFSKK